MRPSERDVARAPTAAAGGGRGAEAEVDPPSRRGRGGGRRRARSREPTPGRARSRPPPSRGRACRRRARHSGRGTGCSRASRAASGAASASSSRASTGRSSNGCSRPRSRSSSRPASTSEAITVMPVPGAFELPLAAMALAKTRRYACIVALGCVIRGETAHFDYVAGEAASGLQLAALETGVPVAFGVLTRTRSSRPRPASTRAPRPSGRRSRWRISSRSSARRLRPA